jgi:hypothetical protein
MPPWCGLACGYRAPHKPHFAFLVYPRIVFTDLNRLRLLGTFDTADEVIFATASTLTHQVFIGLPSMNRAYFRLRQQYYFW